MRAGPCGTERWVPGWPGAGRGSGLSRAALGGAAGGARPLLLEDVLDFLEGLLEVARGPIGAALGPEGLIAGGRTDAFLGFALGRLGGVLVLVFCAHRAASLSWGCRRPLWLRPRG